MSRVTVIMCDCCRKEITGKPFEPDLCLTVILNKAEMTCHYCYQCGSKIIQAINAIVENTKQENQYGEYCKDGRQRNDCHRFE